MIVLDTDHISFLQLKASPEAKRLTDRLDLSHEPIGTTIISAEEEMRGWLTRIARESKPLNQIGPYLRLQSLFGFYSQWRILPWTEAAAEEFATLRASRIRIATMDLKIACIALTNDALLLTRNTVDFERVPGLKFSDWLS